MNQKTYMVGKIKWQKPGRFWFAVSPPVWVGECG